MSPAASSEDALAQLPLESEFLVYVPAYNCAATVVGVLESIPDDVWQVADVLVVDNQSTDETADRVAALNASGTLPKTVHLVQPTENLGYAGSQKLAYGIATRSPAVRWVVMLHGDGQYPPELLSQFVERRDSTAGIVYGYRSKSAYPNNEETPYRTYAIIKGLSALESLLTGVWRREWHSGYVMYSTRFLRRLDLNTLTETMHFDGHMHYACACVGESAEPLAIYKRYRALNAFEGWKRIEYVFQVLGLSIGFHFKPIGRIDESTTTELPGFQVVGPAGGTLETHGRAA